MGSFNVKKPAIACFANLLVLSTVNFVALGPVQAAPSENNVKPASSQKLHRADFRVTGASCVACLRRIGKTIREQKGVVKADVSIFKPYWAIVIYDADLINMEKIADSVKNEKVKFDEIEDKPISSVPLIVIPKGLSKDTGGLPATVPGDPGIK